MLGWVEVELGFWQFANILRFWGGFKQIFLWKISPTKSIWRGCGPTYWFFRGVQMGSVENGGGHYLAPERCRFRTSPPSGCLWHLPLETQKSVLVCNCIVWLFWSYHHIGEDEYGSRNLKLPSPVYLQDRCVWPGLAIFFRNWIRDIVYQYSNV